ncbi:MAG: TlpA family protein disulfide reductase [Ideonella sp.]|jgi:peroxiredoxin|nr:TlpA family protein disulfide reductase [Ideonella sp.]MBL0148717.1 TlpA family protein disulfide reductase [Ideonella sp.]
MTIARRHLAIAAFGLAAVVAAWLLLAGGAARSVAPAVRYALLDGSTLDTEQLKGKVVLVNFWATSCTTCVAEMPHIVAAHQKFKLRGYTTLAVAMSYDPPVFVSGFAESRKLPFGVAIDNTGAIARSFGNVQLTPTSFLIDKHGRVVKRYVGAPDFAALDELVEQLLAET